jgi:hypothetical protein
MPPELGKRFGTLKCEKSLAVRFSKRKVHTFRYRLAEGWHPDNPKPAAEVAKSSNSPYLWLCVNGHAAYTARCDSRTQGTGCPLCGNERRVSRHHPTLSQGRPDLAAEWAPQENSVAPSEVVLGSNYIATWIRREDAEHPRWKAKVHSRALKKSGCPVCSLKNRGVREQARKSPSSE